MKRAVLVALASVAGCSFLDDFSRFSGAEDLNPIAAPDLARLTDGGSPDAASDLALPVDLAAPPDAPVDAATNPDLFCAPGCQGNTLFTCVKPSESCAVGCVPADKSLPAHCALVPTGGDLCGGNYGAAETLPAGKYVLDADAMNNNLPRIRPAAGPGPAFDGVIAGDRLVFCLDALDQSGMDPVILDANTPGYPDDLPLAIVTRNALSLDHVIFWLPGADANGANQSGQGRNGGASGAPAATSANFKPTGGLKGLDMKGTAGGGGGGNRGGSGGSGANVPNLGGAPGQAPIGFVGGGGGGGGGDATGGGAGGAGGGVLQLSAGTTLRFAGAIYVMGGRGAHGGMSLNAPGGGGGGGGGGTVLLESPTIEYPGIACVMVNGGYGGTGYAITGGAGGSFSLPSMPTCPLSATAETPGMGGGGPGGVPAIMDALGNLGGGAGMMLGSGGGGAGGPGALQQRTLKATGTVTIFPDTLATRVTLAY